MIHLFISYGGEDRGFARKLSDKINAEFKGIIKTRVVEDFEKYDGKTWRDKVLEDLNKSSIFIIILTENSKNRPWPNQELGYARALLDNDKIKHIIPVVEAEEVDKDRYKFIKTSGLISEDMTKRPYLITKPRRTISRIIKEIEKLDLDDIEKSINPYLKEFTNNEIRILKFIVEETFGENKKNFIPSLSTEDFQDLKEDFINDTINLLQNEGIINSIAGRISLTPLGLYRYGPIFLKLNVKQLSKTVFDIISSNENTEEIDGKTIYEAAKLSPNLINSIIRLLEEQNYIEVSRYHGTRPYDFSKVRLTLKSRRISRKNLKKFNPQQ